MRSRNVVMALSVAATFCAGGAGAAQAATVTCGQTITQNTTLTSDVGPCPGPGIIIGASNVTLDLGGHTVSGRGTSNGIFVIPSGSRIRNGAVVGFSTGVQTLNSDHVIERLRVRGNARGIVAANGTNVRITDNIVSANTLVGISIGGINTSTIDRNVVSANGGPGIQVSAGGNFSTSNNVIRENTIIDNRGDGVLLGLFVVFQTIEDNTIYRNGGNGIRVRVSSGDQCCALIQRNRIVSNGANGILIDANFPLQAPPNNLNNRILANTAVSNRLFDLADMNPGCRGNTWSGNVFRTRNQTCIR